MTLAADSAANRAACAKQLYDDWNGYYVLQRLEIIENADARESFLFGELITNSIPRAYVTVRELSRDEALTYRAKNDEALRLEYQQNV